MLGGGQLGDRAEHVTSWLGLASSSGILPPKNLRKFVALVIASRNLITPAPANRHSCLDCAHTRAREGILSARDGAHMTSGQVISRPRRVPR
jgi:hypothetical protein